MTYTARFRVWRGDVAGGELQDFDVEVNEGEVVLDIIHRLQATQAGDLAVRWNCKAGKCGSCSAEINGRPRLLCMTRMSVFGEADTITVTPLRAFPVIRDLVTDVSFNYAKAREVPAFSPPEGLKPGEFRMQQVDVRRSQEFRKCIECFLCQDVCHVIRDHEQNKPAFAGPRFFIRVAELDMHPLDTVDRKRQAQDSFGLGLCNITKCCTEVCPEHIKITDNGIIPMKERVVDRKYDPLLTIASRSGRRGAAGSSAAPEPLAAEADARARLRDRPHNRSALVALEEALEDQGRFGEASEVTRQLLEEVGGSRRTRIAALTDHAWALLCAVEAGQLAGPRVVEETGDVLEEAQRLTGTGRTLLGVQAMQATADGRFADAERLLTESLSWQRGAEDRAEDDLTRAQLLALRGEAEQARALVARVRAEWPDNPRLPHVDAALRRYAESSAGAPAD